jgi:hypothetical protein
MDQDLPYNEYYQVRPQFEEYEAFSYSPCSSRCSLSKKYLFRMFQEVIFLSRYIFRGKD